MVNKSDEAVRIEQLLKTFLDYTSKMEDEIIRLNKNKGKKKFPRLRNLFK